MACEFNIGDTVEVVSGPCCGVKIGHRGKIKWYESLSLFPYEVRRRNGNTGAFAARELKLIKRK